MNISTKSKVRQRVPSPPPPPPTYANLTMEFFELTLFEEINLGKTWEILSLKTGAVFSMTVKPYYRKTKSTLVIYLVF